MSNMMPAGFPLVPYEPAEYRVGDLLTGGAEFCITDGEMDHHMAVLGGTGSGKSKFLERLARCFMHSGKGFCFIDPQGDTSEDLMAYAAYRKVIERDNTIWRRVHYLEPSYEMVFGYDPFKFCPIHHIEDRHLEAAYEAWLHTKVDQVSEILQRKQNQMGFEGMPRLQRMLRNVLYATGRAINHFGHHLPLADALVLLDIHHPRHQEVYAYVAPFLPREIRSDFDVLHGFKRVEELRRETESTVNRLRAMLGPVMRGIFAETVNTINFYEIMQKGEILLVNLRETDYFSADQANAIGGLFIHEILSVARHTPRQRRREFTLMIDEAGEFIGQDLLRALRQVRKYKLSMVLAGQDLETFRKGETDMAPTVLSQCGTVVSFQQAYKKDLEILADRLGRGNLNFDELHQVMDRPDGYEFMDMTDYSQNFTWNNGWSEGGSFTHTDTRGTTKSNQQTTTKSWSDGQTQSSGRGHVETTGESESDGKAVHVLLGSKTGAATLSTGQATQQSEADSLQESFAQQHTEGESLAQAYGEALAQSQADGTSRNFGRSGGTGRGFTQTHRKQMVPLTREEWHPTGRYRKAVGDQFEEMMTQIFALQQAQCIVKLKSCIRAEIVQIVQVQEVWRDIEVKYKQIEKLRRELYTLRPYFVVPQMGLDAQEKRLDEFVASGQQRPTSPPPQPPPAGSPPPPQSPFDE